MSNNGLLQIFPKDKYVVLYSHRLSELDIKVINLLYQPLLGASTISIYFNLVYEMRLDEMWSKVNHHHLLLECLNMNLGDFLHCRRKLEAIGLLRVYQKEIDTGSQYIYELNQPLSPKNFFCDETLFAVLSQKLGEHHMEKLINIFSDKKLPKDYNEITASFKDVFEVTLVTESKDILRSEIGNSRQFFSRDEFEGNNNRKLVEEFDFTLLSSVLKGNFFDTKLMDYKKMETIALLSYLYQINVIDMSNLILRSSVDSNIDIEKLKKNAREQFLLEHEQLPSLIDSITPPYLREIKEPKTEEEFMLYEYENNSPLEFLMSNTISNGTRPSANTLNIIEEIMLNQKLNSGVVNVLLHYTLQKSDNKINKKFVEEIATTLARKKITTVKEAYNHFRNSEKINSEKKTLKKKTNGKYNKKENIIPSWKEKQEKQEWTKPSAKQIADLQRMITERRR